MVILLNQKCPSNAMYIHRTEYISVFYNRMTDILQIYVCRSQDCMTVHVCKWLYCSYKALLVVNFGFFFQFSALWLGGSTGRGVLQHPCRRVPGDHFYAILWVDLTPGEPKVYTEYTSILSIKVYKSIPIVSYIIYRTMNKLTYTFNGPSNTHTVRMHSR